jgi:polysaccharide export outer membrane protein
LLIDDESEDSQMMEIRLRTVTFASVVALLASAGMAAQEPTAPRSSQSAGKAIASSPPASSPQLQQRYPRYVIQREDVLLISFPLSPELNQAVTVQPDGFINLQSAGSLHVQGMTVPEMVSALKQAYTGILHDPIINVDLEDFQKPFFTVTGQVGKPGQYELRSDITVAEAIAVAGGLQPTAKTQIFLFHRTSNDWFQVEKLNLKDVLNGKHANEDAILRPGDMVVVPEKFIVNFRKYVPYSLNAGTYLQGTQY